MKKWLFILELVLSFSFINKLSASTINCSNGLREDGVTSCNKCGDDCSWSISDDGKLTVSGTGKIYDFDVNAYYTYVSEGQSSQAPWHAYYEQINSVEIAEGINNIGQKAFSGLSHASEISIPNSVEIIGAWAFSSNRSLQNITIPSSVTYIEGGAFEATGLTNIDIPDSVTHLGYCTFLNTPLQTISLSDKTLSNEGDPFRNSNPESMTIYCRGDLAKCKAHFESRYQNAIQSYPRPIKRIYTVEEAAAVSKKTGNTIKLRYK